MYVDLVPMRDELKEKLALGVALLLGAMSAHSPEQISFEKLDAILNDAEEIQRQISAEKEQRSQEGKADWFEKEKARRERKKKERQGK